MVMLSEVDQSLRDGGETSLVNLCRRLCGRVSGEHGVLKLGRPFQHVTLDPLPVGGDQLALLHELVNGVDAADEDLVGESLVNCSIHTVFLTINLPS